MCGVMFGTHCRLLQGDVGSGKTVVAFLAMLAAAGNGYQVRECCCEVEEARRGGGG